MFRALNELFAVNVSIKVVKVGFLGSFGLTFGGRLIDLHPSALRSVGFVDQHSPPYQGGTGHQGQPSRQHIASCHIFIHASKRGYTILVTLERGRKDGNMLPS